MVNPRVVTDEEIEALVARRAEQRQPMLNAARALMDARFAEWLQSRATTLLPTPNDDDLSEAHGEREDDLARLITTTPAVSPWQVFVKFEVLEHYLCGEGGTNWTDNREIVMLAGIKADLLRFKIESIC